MFQWCNAERVLCISSVIWTQADCSRKLWPVEHLLICICTRVDKNHHQVYCPDCFICWGMGVKWDTINSCEPKSTLSINLVIVAEHSSGGGGGSLSSGECEVKEIQWKLQHTADLPKDILVCRFYLPRKFQWSRYEVIHVGNMRQYTNLGKRASPYLIPLPV